MTACVSNKKYGRRVAGVVTASLVGALTLGGVSLAAVPTVALAEDAALQFSTDALSKVSNVNYKVDGKDVKPLDKQYTLFSADGAEHEIDVDSFTLPGSNATETVGDDYKVTIYSVDADGNKSPLANNKVKDPGKYAVELVATSGAVPVKYEATFYVAGASLDAVASDATGLKYTGYALKVQYGDLKTYSYLTEGEDYTVSYQKSDGTTTNEVKDAGTYTPTLTGLGKYAGTTKTLPSFTVAPFETHYAVSSKDEADTLAAGAEQIYTVVEVAPFVGAAPTHPTKAYNYNTKTGDVHQLDPSLVTLATSGSAAPSRDGKGVEQAFKASVVKSALDAGNVTNAAGSFETNNTVYGKVADKAATLRYGGQDLQDSYTFDTSAEQSFDLTAVSAKAGKASWKAADVDDAVVVKGVDAYGNAFKDAQDSFDKGEAGTYTVVASFYGQSDGDWFAASKTFTVKYVEGSVDADSSLFVYYNADPKTAITSFSKAYDGKAVTASDFTVGGNDADGNPYDQAALKKTLVDSEGKEVKEAKAAGTYTLKVTSDKYQLSGTTDLPVTIAKVDLTKVEVGALEQWNVVAGETYLPLAGEADAKQWYKDSAGYFTLTGDKSQYDLTDAAKAISSLKLQWATGSDADGKDGDADLKGLDLLPSNVGVTVEHQVDGEWKPVSTINKWNVSSKIDDLKQVDSPEGHYRVTLTVNKADAANYVLPEGQTQVTLEFDAYEKQAFSDVQPSDWFYKAVNAARKAGYMSGYGNSTFGPTNPLTRAQAAAIFFNMSGQRFNETDAWYNKETGWKTGFEDVDGTQWYGQAVAWAKSTGVVNGYDATHFGPEDPVTREQFVSMLANYAKVVNRDTTVDTADASALDGFSDASQVDSWARQNFAWAVSKKVAGNGGYLGADSVVTRAEAAGMSTNYQPERKQ